MYYMVDRNCDYNHLTIKFSTVSRFIFCQHTSLNMHYPVVVLGLLWYSETKITYNVSFKVKSSSFENGV
jgi:hypothetical protein